MQKWVDAHGHKDITTPSPEYNPITFNLDTFNTGSSNVSNISKESYNPTENISILNVTNTDEDSNKEETEHIKRIWSKEELITRFNQSIDKTKTLEVGSFGRAKLNEFYDKVSINKIKYNIRARKMNTSSSPPLPTSKNKFSESYEYKTTSSSEKTDENNVNDNVLKLQKNKPNNILLKDDDFLSFSEKFNLLGHNGKLQSTPKNINLGNIGRSFSEANDDDEDEDLYLLNERSQSYSHVVGNRITLNNNNVSHSLPSFLENKSLSSSSINPLLNLNPTQLVKRTITTLRPSNIKDRLVSEGQRKSVLLRDSSIQSDSSHCSSVESLLESRKPDPEAILINLGFGPVESEDVLSRIPKRFLKPSKVRGIDTEAFLRRQQLASHLYDHSVLGYRGLVGNPDVPPSTIVAKIMERFEQNERNRCVMDINMNRPQSAPPTPEPNLLN